MSENLEGTPHVRNVLLTSILTSVFSGLAYVAIRGQLLVWLMSNPLAVIGGVLGVGLVGMWIGTFCGLSFKMLMCERAGRYVPVLISGGASAVAGLLIAYFFVEFFR